MCEKAENLIASSGSNEMGHHHSSLCVSHLEWDNLIATEPTSHELIILRNARGSKNNTNTELPSIFPRFCDCTLTERLNHKLYAFKDTQVKWVAFLCVYHAPVTEN